jgi:hypothetical protein
VSGEGVGMALGEGDRREEILRETVALVKLGGHPAEDFWPFTDRHR